MFLSISSLNKVILTILVIVLLQGCSSFRTCAVFLDKDEYISSPHYKAVAGYFDRETLRPPAKLGGVKNECWFDIEGNSQEEANSIVLYGCEESLKQKNRFDEWSCILIAEGDQLTEFEQQRVDDWRRIAGRTKKEDSRMLTGSQGTGSYDPDK